MTWLYWAAGVVIVVMAILALAIWFEEDHEH